MPYIVKHRDPDLKSIAATIANDSTRSIAARDRLLKRLADIDNELPKLHDKTAAQVTLESLLPAIAALQELANSFMPGVPPLDADNYLGILERLVLVVTEARENRRAEVARLVELDCYDPALTAHGNVMAAIDTLKMEAAHDADRRDEEDAGEGPENPADERADAGVHAGHPTGSDRSAHATGRKSGQRKEDRR